MTDIEKLKRIKKLALEGIETTDFGTIPYNNLSNIFDIVDSVLKDL